MNQIARVLLLSLCCSATFPLFTGCNQSISSPAATFATAPPGPADLGPATGLSTPPSGAVVVDLNYRPQTGADSDIPYRSYWGYGGSTEQAKDSPFLKDVRRKSGKLYYVQNPSFKGREWAAVEYRNGQATALYFDLDADGKVDDNERFAPTRKEGQEFEFITPDFMHKLENGGEMLCRTLLEVNFYQGSEEPNCMWSPAAVMEGSAPMHGRASRLLLFAGEPGGRFDRYGASYYALIPADRVTANRNEYIPRERLSTLICYDDQFYHFKVEGTRSNGLPAQVVLLKDSTPTGTVSFKLEGANAMQAKLTSIFLSGADDKTVFFHCDGSKSQLVLPEGSYNIDNGYASYNSSSNNARGWEVSFSAGPRATVKAGQVLEVALGQPTLKVRAVEERNRYDRQRAGASKFKKGTQIYLEPQILGKGGELFTRFRQPTIGSNEKPDRPPTIKITNAEGKQLLASTMEYG